MTNQQPSFKVHSAVYAKRVLNVSLTILAKSISEQYLAEQIVKICGIQVEIHVFLNLCMHKS